MSSQTAVNYRATGYLAVLVPVQMTPIAPNYRSAFYGTSTATINDHRAALLLVCRASAWRLVYRPACKKERDMRLD